MSLYGSWLHRRLVPVHDLHVVVDQGLPMTRVDVFVYRCQVCWRLFEVERWHVEETGVIVERSCGDILDLWYGVNALEERQAAELAQHVVNVAVGPVDRSVRHAEVHKWA